MPLVTSLTTHLTSPQYNGLFQDPLGAGAPLETEEKFIITEASDFIITEAGDFIIGDFPV